MKQCPPPGDAECSASEVDSSAALSSRLRAVRAELASGPWTLDHLQGTIGKLEAFVFAQAHRHVDLPSQIQVESLEMLQEAYGAWETLLERQFARDTIKGVISDYERYALSQRFQRLIGRELGLVHGGVPKRVLFLGSGPFPISAIWLHRLTGTIVDCVDHDPEAVRISSECLRALGLGHDIRVLYGQGQDIDASGHDFVLIALLAKPKKAILRRLRETVPPECRIVCRTSHGLRQLLYEPTDRATAIEPWFHVVDEAQVLNGEPDTISSFALRPRVSGVT